MHTKQQFFFRSLLPSPPPLISSADINPIGGIAKGDLRAFLLHAAAAYGFSTLVGVVAAPPSAELVPLLDAAGQPTQQLDEVDMGMTYSELGAFG